jgi:protein-L-isoaspartate(D-aspartate) O-methyltransferase
LAQFSIETAHFDLMPPLLLRPLCSTRAGGTCRSLSVLSGISEDLLVSTSIGHQIGGDSHTALVDSMVRTNVVAAGSRLEFALRRVDRGDFVAPAFRDASERYANRPLKIGTVATISTPQQHAQVLGLLEPHLQPGMTAVDVGCGSGILVAAMTHLVGPLGFVTGVDIVPELVEFSKENLQRSLGKEAVAKQTKIIASAGKKDLGLPADGRYDCMHVGVAVETKAEAESFLHYLKPGGGLLIPLGGAGAEQKLVKVRHGVETWRCRWKADNLLCCDVQMTKLPDGSVDKRDIMSVLCQPMLDSIPVEVVRETRTEKLARVEKALTQWRQDFEAKNGRKPMRGDLMDNAEAKELFQEFASLRK